MSVDYGGDNSRSGPSPGLWGNWKGHVAPDDFITMFEDFKNLDQTLGQASGDMSAFGDTNTAAAALMPTEVGGVVQLQTGGTDNEQVAVVSGDNTAGFVKIAADKSLWFEARIRPVQVANHNLFVGLAQEALAAGDLITDADALGDFDVLGWYTLHADEDVIEPVFNTTGGTAVVVKADAQTIVAATWYKLGFYFNGTTIAFYINGVQITGCDIRHPIKYDVTDVPDGEELAAYCYIKDYDNNSAKLDVDWAKCSLER